MASADDRTAVDHFASIAASYENNAGSFTRQVALFLLELPPLQGACSAGSLVLDNACGTGIMTEEIIKRCRRTGGEGPEIRLVDPAPPMVEAARAKIKKLGIDDRSSVATMPGEKLDFPDNTFDFSITNMGIPFFADGVEGARAIYRTLKPGGAAVVTSWQRYGPVEDVLGPAQKAVRPNDEPLKMPMAEQWSDPNYLHQLFEKDAGFSDVSTVTTTVYLGAPDLDGVYAKLINVFEALWKEWPEEDVAAFKPLVRQQMEAKVQKYTLPSGEINLGLPLIAVAVVGKK